MVDKADRQTRLKKAIEYSQRQMEGFQKQRLRVIEKYVTSKYTGNKDKNTPVDFLELAITTYLSHLVGKSPSAMVSTFYPKMKAPAMYFELALNFWNRKIKLQKTLRRWNLDALFGWGILKIGLGADQRLTVGETEVKTAEPFVDCVDLDDFIIDMTARCIDEAQFIGNKFRVTKDFLMESGLYDKDEAEKITKLQPSSDGLPYDKTEDIRKDGAQDDRFIELYELYEIFLPSERKIITMNPKTNEILREIPWAGPVGGPYKFLSFNDVPSNVLPLPPAFLWEDLHDLGNSVFRKLSRQATNEKNVLLGIGVDESDLTKIRDSSDGEIIKTNIPNGSLQQQRFNGINPASMGFYMQLQQIYSRMAGNLDALGGLGPQTDTVGQEQLIGASASLRLSAMQTREIEAVTEVEQAIGFYIWNDPMMLMQVIYRVPGTEIDVPVMLTPDMRTGDYLDYTIEIEPYSMEHQTRATKLNALMQALNTLAPMMPMMQQQGVSLNIEKLVRLMAKLSNTPEISDVIDFFAPAQQQGQPGQQEQMPMPAQTTRKYERISRPGTTQSAQENAIMNAVMGKQLQPAEMNAGARSVG